MEKIIELYEEGRLPEAAMAYIDEARYAEALEEARAWLAMLGLQEDFRVIELDPYYRTAALEARWDGAKLPLELELKVHGAPRPVVQVQGLLERALLEELARDWLEAQEDALIDPTPEELAQLQRELHELTAWARRNRREFLLEALHSLRKELALLALGPDEPEEGAQELLEQLAEHHRHELGLALAQTIRLGDDPERARAELAARWLEAAHRHPELAREALEKVARWGERNGDTKARSWALRALEAPGTELQNGLPHARALTEALQLVDPRRIALSLPETVKGSTAPPDEDDPAEIEALYQLGVWFADLLRERLSRELQPEEAEALLATFPELEQEVEA